MTLQGQIGVSMEKEIILETKKVTKTFPGVVALKDINLVFRSGEVHAIIGENGAGKSTLMNIMSGVYQPDAGSQIYYRGQKVEFRSTAEAAKCGIAMIHQENSLVQHLKVYENIYLGNFLKKGQFIDKKTMRENASKLLEKMHIGWIKPDTYVKDLSSSEQQLIEIAKALSRNPETIIFDEPTASLTVKETSILMDLIRELKENGTAIAFISHHLEELFEIADVISVLRDGEYIGTYKTEEIDIPKLISLMVGRQLKSNVPQKTPELIAKRAATKDNPVILEAKGISVPGKADHVSFTLHKGEILGFAGLVGAGRTELMEGVFGYTKRSSGEIFLDGKEVNIKTPKDAVRLGIGMLSEDRKMNGILPLHSVRDNINCASWPSLKNGKLFVSRSAEKKNADNYITRLNVKTPTAETRISSLSGGNQQKALLGRILSIKPRVLILDEPTHGIDVGAKEEIYELINRMADEGIAILLISSELPELITLSHRIIVMAEGEKRGELEFSDFDQETILNFASGTENVS